MARSKGDITVSSFFYLVDTLTDCVQANGERHGVEDYPGAIEFVRALLNDGDMERVEALKKDCEAYDRVRSGYVPAKRGRKPMVDVAAIAAETLAKFNETPESFARMVDGHRKVALGSMLASAIAAAKAVAKSAKLSDMLLSAAAE